MALVPWIRIGQPLENVLDDYERILDAWDAGGIRGLVFGRLVFADGKGGFTVPAFRPDPEPFRRRGLELAPAAAGPDAAREKQLHAMLDDVKRRGWPVLVFCPGQSTHSVSAPPGEDPFGALNHAAVWEDVFTAFPQADGGVMDGWAELPYEFGAVFRGLTAADRRRAEATGHDADRLDEGRRQLMEAFSRLTPGRVRYYGHHGMLSAMNLFDLREDGVHWLRWRREASLAEGRAFRAELDRLPRKLLLGNGLRTAMFTGITGIDYAAWDGILDLMLVKHYFWQRGFDGLYGTITRWVEKVKELNPGLTEADCFTVVRAWFGTDLPEVESRADMDHGFPQAFFDETVAEETRRALAAASRPEKVLPWVDTGRMPHRGDPMTAGDLKRILEASEGAGLRRFLFHNHGHLTAAEWKVISRMCGREWDEDPDGYWPPNSPPKEVFR